MDIKPINNLINYIIKNYKTINYEKKIINFDNNEKNKLCKLLNFKDLDNKKSYIGKEFIKLKNHIIINIKSKLNINLNIYTYNDFNNELLINNIVNRIYNMIELFYKYNDNKNLTIYLLLYDCPRIIPLTYKNSPNDMNKIYELNLFNCVNGWFRNIDDNNKEILITRLKTCEGLLIHELCHLCDLDFGGYNIFNEWNNYKKQYNIINHSEFTEGINNAISSIIHAIICSIEDKENYKLYLDCEYYYSKDLVSNLLHFFKCNKIIQLKNNNYNQNSMMFEYIILRYCYLKYIKDLFHLDNNFNDIKINKSIYFNKFIKKLKELENKEFNLNNNMIIKINNEKTNLLRMEYYLL